MPGRTPTEAFEEFITPIKQAIACLGQGVPVVSSGGRGAIGKVHAWSLNQERGMALKDGVHFDAQMHYEIIPDEAGGFRVTTKAYRYKLQIVGDIQFMMHWHPTGNSPYALPHLHLPSAQSLSEDTHLPTPRFTFEDAVEWTIKISGQHARDDWQTILNETRERHVAFRTWDTHPGQPRG